MPNISRVLRIRFLVKFLNKQDTNMILCKRSPFKFCSHILVTPTHLGFLDLDSQSLTGLLHAWAGSENRQQLCIGWMKYFQLRRRRRGHIFDMTLPSLLLESEVVSLGVIFYRYLKGKQARHGLNCYDRKEQCNSSCCLCKCVYYRNMFRFGFLHGMVMLLGIIQFVTCEQRKQLMMSFQRIFIHGCQRASFIFSLAGRRWICKARRE